MIRRRFLQGMTIASANLSAAARQVKATYKVAGFTCMTCAVGLETLLKAQSGVIGVKATYPDGVVSVDYEPQLITDSQIQRCIREMGFGVTSEYQR